jgi:hypothetical protein
LEFHDHGLGRTNRRALFAILCLVDLALTIVEFIAEGIFDLDMPFTADSSGALRRNSSCSSPVGLFQDWSRRDRDLFSHYQGSVLVAYFEFSKGDSAKITQLRLSPTAILPFIEDEAAPQETMLGGFSMVRKIRVHDAHHDLNQTSVSDPSLCTLFPNSQCISSILLSKSCDTATQETTRTRNSLILRLRPTNA